MKKLTITLLAMLFCFAQIATAQTNDAKAAASAVSSSFDVVASSIKSLKDQAASEFAKEQSSIDAEKSRLVSVRADIEKDNAAEKDMMADKWPPRVAAKTKLIQDEQAVRIKEQKLHNRMKAFEHKAAQLEQRAASSLAMDKEHLDGMNANMQSFIAAIKATEY
jgi:hypothetical protein